MAEEDMDTTLEAAKQNQSSTTKLRRKDSTNGLQTSTIFDWADDFILSEEEANAISDPQWIIPNLIISGHVVLIPAEPNGGKTTIMFYLAGLMAKQNYKVFYVNVDISGGDAKPLVKIARDCGFNLLLPDMKTGLSIDNVIHKLLESTSLDTRFDDTIFIFDTVKKLVNVMSKDAAKRFFTLMRTLSAKGMTIILLAHTNKYTDKEGKPIYEGTGDMRADVDDLIYLVPKRNEDKSMVVTTMPDKQRGSFEPISFNITSDRTVSVLGDVIDTLAANKFAKEVEKDRPIIDAIKSAIEAGNSTQKAIIEYCSNHKSIGERLIKAVLSKYAYSHDESVAENQKVNHFWHKKKGERKSYNYSLLNTM